jgi:hypothetical protein
MESKRRTHIFSYNPIIFKIKVWEARGNYEEATVATLGLFFAWCVDALSREYYE